jgi:hypothetical protein
MGRKSFTQEPKALVQATGDVVEPGVQPQEGKDLP